MRERTSSIIRLLTAELFLLHTYMTKKEDQIVTIVPLGQRI